MPRSYDDLSGDSFGASGTRRGDSGWGTSYGSDAASGFTSQTRPPSLPTQVDTSHSMPRITAPTVGRTTNGYGPSGMSYLGGSNSFDERVGSQGSPGAQDPALAQDKHARDVYSSLQSAGHDVKWQGNQLMVDGRPYDLGTPATPTSPMPDVPVGNPSMPNGIDPHLSSLYQKYGVTPGDRGSGFTDWQYWQNEALNNAHGDWNYVTDRLGADLAGNGPDAGAGGGGGGGSIGGDWGPSFAAIRTAGGNHQVPSFSAPSAPWGPDGPSVYTPGTIGFDDIPNFTPDSLLAQMRSGGAAQGLDSLVQDIQSHPTSLDDHAVDTMKAQMKDTLAEQQQFQDQNLKGMGASMGIGDSPWLASERAASQRSRDQAIASGAQNVDIQAAQTRAADKRAAAGVGQSYQQLRSQQTMDTVNAGLQRASVTGNRLALRESVAQAAAASRQSAQKVMADWIQQNAGLKLDYAKLSTQNSQYLEELMMRTQQLAEQRQEFGANLQRGLNQDAWAQSYAENNI